MTNSIKVTTNKTTVEPKAIKVKKVKVPKEPKIKEVKMTALEKKIAALEKEIASELQASKDDEKNAQNLQLKEALLSSYQAQLSELESQKLESSSA